LIGSPKSSDTAATPTAREREKREFFELADRLAQSSDSSEQKRLKKELARMTYGE
jgi:hypothetical protein